MKNQVILYNAFSLILLNTVFWVCNYYPRHLLEFSSGWVSIISVIFNLIYIASYLFILHIFFVKRKMLFSKDIFNGYQPFSRQEAIKRITVLLLAQAVLDILLMITKYISFEFQYIVTDVSILFSWLIVYFVLTYKQENIFVNTKKLLILMFFLIGAMSICVVFDINALSEYRMVIQKYSAESNYLIQTIRNLNFENSIKSLILDCALGCIFIIIHLWEKEKHKKKTRDIFTSSNKIGKATIRVFILVCVALLTISLKMLICRDSSIRDIDVSSLEHTSYSSGRKIYANAKNFKVSRMKGYKTKINVYNKTKVEIYNGSIKLAEVCYPNDQLPLRTEIQGNQMIIEDSFEEYSIDGVSVYTFNDQVVCIIENGVARAIAYDEISRCGENAVLTKLCEQLISQGNIVMFEHSYQYMLTYDKEFIEPYIERYANANFDSQEEDCINRSGYKKEYIVSVASCAN